MIYMVVILIVMYTSPIYLDEHSKKKVEASVWNDSLFLSSLDVMDYSLVGGVDGKHFVVGIIGKFTFVLLFYSFYQWKDFLRQYTWDKQLETWVKSTGIMGGGGKDPTIISPKQYKIRFRKALNFYFVMVPNKYTNYRLRIPSV
jgi:1-phosphatidylinositol-3-phosphate 5-kinase